MILTSTTKLMTRLILKTLIFEEMNDKAGQTNGSYFPFPSKIFAQLYLLLNSPHPMV